jgi:hypothetical protein
MALSDDKIRTYSHLGDDHQEYDVASGETIYEGALVGLDSDSLAVALDGSTHSIFAGVRLGHTVDNSGGSDGDKLVEVLERGYLKVTVADGVTAGSEGTTLYAADDDTINTSSTDAVKCGIVAKVLDASANEVLMLFKPTGEI